MCIALFTGWSILTWFDFYQDHVLPKYGVVWSSVLIFLAAFGARNIQEVYQHEVQRDGQIAMGSPGRLKCRRNHDQPSSNHIRSLNWYIYIYTDFIIDFNGFRTSWNLKRCPDLSWLFPNGWTPWWQGWREALGGSGGASAQRNDEVVYGGEWGQIYWNHHRTSSLGFLRCWCIYIYPHDWCSKA